MKFLDKSGIKKFCQLIDSHLKGTNVSSTAISGSSTVDAALSTLNSQIVDLKNKVGPYMFSLELDPSDGEMHLYLYYPDGSEPPPITLEGDTLYWNY